MKSFANALNPHLRNRTVTPVRNGEFLSINIDDALHRQGVRKLENTLIGLLMLKQGVKPTTSLKDSLDQIWQIQGPWRLITLGKGYFNIQLEDESEHDRIFTKRSWPSEFGTMRLQRWTPEFNPYKISSPMVNVWVHIYEIPQEYFHEHIIESIASALVNVVSIDQRIKDGSMCHYARVLIELDL